MKMTFFYSSALLFCLCLMGCKKTVNGCMDAGAINYNKNANKEDGSCEYLGQAVFWSPQPVLTGTTYVSYADNTITFEGNTQNLTTYTASAPGCSGSNCVIVSAAPGTYNWYYEYSRTTVNGTSTVSIMRQHIGSVTISSKGCSAVQLTTD